jgi:nucleotide-binding universal stress UspA family protein
MATPVFQRIVVPTDFSSTAEAAWSLARRLAGAVGAEIVLAHVLVETAAFSEGPFTMASVREVYASTRKWAEEAIERWAAEARSAGLTVRTVLRTGVPHEEIAALAREEKADLIVIGTHGRGGLDRVLLGSVADRVVRVGACPVLCVREPA